MWNTNNSFFLIIKLVSKILCHVFIVTFVSIWFLDATFPNRWIGRDGPTPWPPRSPDITPLDIFFYGGMLWTKCFRHQFQILQI